MKKLMLFSILICELILSSCNPFWFLFPPEPEYSFVTIPIATNQAITTNETTFEIDIYSIPDTFGRKLIPEPIYLAAISEVSLTGFKYADFRNLELYLEIAGQNYFDIKIPLFYKEGGSDELDGNYAFNDAGAAVPRDMDDDGIIDPGTYKAWINMTFLTFSEENVAPFGVQNLPFGDIRYLDGPIRLIIKGSYGFTDFLEGWSFTLKYSKEPL